MPITRRRLLTSALGLGAAALTATGSAKLITLASSRGPRKLHRVERSGHALGTTVHLTVLHDDVRDAEQAIDAAFEQLDHMEGALSIYRPESTISRLNRDGYVEGGSGFLTACIETAIAMSQATDGAFDITVQPLWELYADAQREGRVPLPREIEAARSLVDYRQIEFSYRRIAFAKPGMAVTLNGIAQGYALDQARHVLRQCGIRHALLDVGELGALGDKHGEPWKAGVQHPRIEDAYATVTMLDSRCLATSGDYATSFTADRSANHLIDPRTGRSPTEFASVSVLARTAMHADALSTALFVMGFERSLQLIRSTRNVDAFFVFKDGRTFATKGFPQA